MQHTKSDTAPALPYNPEALPRELARHYITATDAELEAMLAATGSSELDDLYSHIPPEYRFSAKPDLPEELSYKELQKSMEAMSRRNSIRPSFVGDGLHAYTVPPIVPFVSNIRNLATAYTPYQPERSQGTLITHWIYQCAMTRITGFDAINSSLYDRATAIFEAACTAIRLSRKADTVVLAETLFPSDLEVVKTLAADTEVKIRTVPLALSTGRIDATALDALMLEIGPERLAGVVFPQVNHLGLLENVHDLTNRVHRANARVIAVIDPMLLADGGLVEPIRFGERGADMIVGEAQHLAVGPNFGGPGLGLFGIRTDADHRNDIRQSPGRYVGKAKDITGRESCVMVLSTREQHIRKDKATSNICSNQAFFATLAGASLLSRGAAGLKAAATKGRQQAVEAVERLTRISGIRLAYPDAPFYNEIVIALPEPVSAVIEAGVAAGLHVGVDVSSRTPARRNLLKLTFTDIEADIDGLEAFFANRRYAGPAAGGSAVALPESLCRITSVQLPSYSDEELQTYFLQLGELNVSPDDACYPLGSCTMKYNPYINEWAANLPGFTQAHPQAPSEDIQGCLEVLFEIQEWFRKITGLPAVTTQPVAGAQGELVGLKLFQAYHRDRDDAQRDVVFIPSSAHGTNFATAAMAGYPTRKVDGRQAGIVLLESDKNGLIDEADFETKLALHGPHLAGIMVTNPNTCGLFETRFREIAAKVNQAGGLVYMDGANMNAIAGWCDLKAMGVDAVHNNLHKTWTIPHGGGGPGDAIVAVSERLAPYLPGMQIEKNNGRFEAVRAPKSIGSFHRHWGNFAHKVRALTYLKRLGRDGIPRMTAVATLSARYCFERLRRHYPTLPEGALKQPRMHEFILTLEPEDFQRAEAAGVPENLVITRVGKLFLDFGFHAPTVAWPETFGLMIEPTESYSKAELDRFCEAVEAIRKMIREHPEVLAVVPLFTPVDRIDDVAANRQLQLAESLDHLPPIHPHRLAPNEIAAMSIEGIYAKIVETAKAAIESQTPSEPTE